MKKRPTRKAFRLRLEQMVHELRSDILNGKYSPGDFLPSETVLVKQFQLSNKSIRKGLEELVQEGLIVKKHRIGSMVTERSRLAKITITLGCSPSIERDLELQQLLHDFQADYPAIRVNTVTIASTTSFDYLKTAREYLENGLIDVLTMNHLNYQEFVENHSTHLLEPLPKNKKIYPFLTDAFSNEQQLYVQPLVFSPLILCYNKDHFHAADLLEPDSGWTWDDVTRAAQFLSRNEQRHGLYFHLLSENRWPVFLLQSGVTFERNEQRRYQICGTKLMESIRMCGNLIHNRNIFPNYLSESNDDAIQLFAEEKVSMIVLNYMSMNEFKHSDLNYDISPLPFIHEPKTLLVAIGMAVNRYSKEKEAAKLLVEYLFSEKAQRMIRQRTLSIPSMKPIAEADIEEDDRLKRPSSYSLFREIIPTFRLHRDLNLTIRAFKVVRNLLKMYWSDMIDEQTLCARMEQELAEEDQPY